MNGKPQYRLKTSSIVIFLSTAAIADIITFFPGAGDVVAPVFWPLAAIYLWKNGLGFVNGRRIAVEAVSFIAELIPVVQEFPMIFIGAVSIVVMSRAEDKLGIKVPLKGTGIRSPMNNKGVRMPRNQTTARYTPQIPTETGSSGGAGRVINYNTRPLNSDGVRVATHTPNQTGTSSAEPILVITNKTVNN